MPGEAYLNLALLRNQTQTAPGAPNGLVQQSVQSTTLEIRWNDLSANESGFYIERCTGTGCSSFAQIHATGANVTTFQDTNLNPVTTYAYRVRAFNGIGNSTYTSTVEITTLDIQAVSGLNDYGTLQDEKDAYAIFGWTYTGGQLPTIGNGPYTVGAGIDVHDSLEADDLWQNIIMAERTGVQGYTNLATAWATYYKDSFPRDFQAGGEEEGFGFDHTFGWGLVDWAVLSGNNAFLSAANSIADIVQAFWYNTNVSNGYRNGFYSLRGPGRHLLLACTLNRRQWADDIWNGTANLDGLKNSFRWREPFIGATQVGFWMEAEDTFGTTYQGATGVISSFEFATLNNGLAAYYELTGNLEVKRRLILMARFAQLFGLDTSGNPPVNHTGTWIICDFPSTGQFFHRGLGSGILLQPFYTCTLINTLVRGYLLTGDTALLDRAKLHWDRSSRATEADTYPYTNRPSETAGEVNHFMSSVMASGGIFYYNEGELNYVGLLFKAYTSLNPNLSTPNPPHTLTTTVISSSQINLQWVDASNNETGFEIYRCSGASCTPSTLIATVGVDVNTYPDQGLSAATLFGYRVRAINGNGPSTYSAIDYDTTSAGGGGTVPTAPGSLTVTAVAYNQINLTWTDLSSDESGFRIERCSGAACSSFTTVTTTGPGVTTYSNFGLTASTLYRYRVYSFNGAGDSASPTSVEQATTSATSDLWSVAPNSSWRTFVESSPQNQYITPGNTPDGKSTPITNVLNCWSSGPVFERSNGEQWMIIKNGGHDSWFWNDVFGYRINGGTQGWQLLKKSYLPYITASDWDGDGVTGALGMDPTTWNGTTGQLGNTRSHTIFTDGSPANAHTYDLCGYSPETDEVWFYAGAHTNGSGRQAPINHFSMATHTWSYGPYWSSYFPNFGGVSDVMSNGNIMFDASGSGGMKLMEYDPTLKQVSDLNTTTSLEYVSYSTGRIVGTKMYVFHPDVPVFSKTVVKIHEAGIQGETTMQTSGATIPAYAGPGVVWEPTVSKFVVWGGGRNIYLLDPATRIIEPRETIPISEANADPGSPIAEANNSHKGTYKRFGRLGAGSYILMNSIDRIHLLTLDLGGGPPATTINFTGSTDLRATNTGELILTGSHTFSGSNRLGIVCILGDNNLGGSGVDNISSVRVGTTGGAGNDGFCTLIRKKTTSFPDTDARIMYVYAILNPATGSQTVTITVGSDHPVWGMVASYSGVQQSAQPDAQTDNASPLQTSSSLTSSLTVGTTDSWVILLEQSYDGGVNGPSSGAGDVLRITNTDRNFSLFDSNSAVAASTNYQMTTSRSTSPTTRGISHILVSFKPA